MTLPFVFCWREDMIRVVAINRMDAVYNKMVARYHC
jgi:hypothetical protein